MLDEQFGAKVPMLFEPIAGSEPATESIADATERSRQERMQEITDGAIARPVVQSATRILGGEIKKVVPERSVGQMSRGSNPDRCPSTLSARRSWCSRASTPA